MAATTASMDAALAGAVRGWVACAAELTAAAQTQAATTPVDPRT